MKKLSVIIGRFQTASLHNGHLAFINSAKSKGDELLIIIGSARAKFTRRNPLDFPVRKLLLEKEFPTAIIKTNFDQKSNKVWSNNVDKIIDDTLQELGEPMEVNLFGGRQSFLPFYEGKYPKTELTDCIVENVSATFEREKIGLNPRNSEDFRAGIIYNCQNSYEKTHPTIDCAVFNEDYTQIILGRKHAETLFRFIGGFVDISDSSYEMACRREVFEEASVEVSDLQYVTSMKVNDWRYIAEPSESIMTTLFAGKYIMGAVKGNDDIAEAHWFSFDNLKEDDIVFEHGRLLQILKDWVKKKREIIKENLAKTLSD